MNLVQDMGKAAAGRTAAEFVEDGMLVGIGTGSTVRYFIERLAERCREGLNVTAVSTSRASESLASEGGITVKSMDGVTSVDLTVDGADEIDPQKRMIKGGGGALLREKIIAASSGEMIVIIDASKCVEQLGAFPLPLELVPFGIDSTVHRLGDLGLRGSIRQAENAPFLTDNGNFILDVILDPQDLDSERLHSNILQVPGVVDTGFFFDLAGRVVIGHSDGSVEIRP